MAEVKADATQEHRLVIAETDISDQKPNKTMRVASLDIFRGLTVAVSLFLKRHSWLGVFMYMLVWLQIII